MNPPLPLSKGLCGVVGGVDGDSDVGADGVRGDGGGSRRLTVRGMARAGMHWKGGGVPPLPLQGAHPMPSHCLHDGKYRPQWHL